MANTFNLTNEQQIWIMNKVKNKQLSLDEAENAASIMSGTEPVKELASPKIKEQVMGTNTLKAFTFGVIRFPYGFSDGNGIKNSIQIDFRNQSIYFMDKITINVILGFHEILDISSDEDNFGIELETRKGGFKFTTNMEYKAEIERLISMIIQKNQFEMSRTFTSPIRERGHSHLQSQSGVNFQPAIMAVLNKRQVLKEGIIEKKGNAAIVRWSRRFLRVEEREFSYFEPNKEGDPLGVVQITPSTEIDVLKSDHETFAITVGKRSYFFRVRKMETPEKTEAERYSWVLAFKEARSQRTLMNSVFIGNDERETLRCPSPTIDYDHSDGNGFSQGGHSSSEIEMMSFKNPPPSPSGSAPVPAPRGQQQQQQPPTPRARSSSSGGDVYATIIPTRKAPLIPGNAVPRSPGLVPPGPRSLPPTSNGGVPSAPPPPPPPPPPLGPAPGQEVRLKAHCHTKLKHFFVPKVHAAKMNNTIWGILNDISPKLDMNLMEEHFAEEIRRSESIQKETPRVSYMDSKKTQNILILMKSDLFIQTIKRLPELINTICTPEDNEIDMVRTLQKYQPTEDEIELYQKLTNDNVSFSKADKIMLTMTSIPFLRKRLELVLNLWTFESQYEEFIQFLHQLINAFKEILNSKKFLQVLEYVLAISNLMNTSGPNSSTVAMRGFHLNFLLQLKDIRNANGYSVLKLLVSQIKKTQPEILNFYNELKKVEDCENISVKAIHASTEVLKKDLKSIVNSSKAIKRLIKQPTKEENEFFQDIEGFYKNFQQKLDLTVKDTTKIQQEFGKILDWFGLPSTTSSENFFRFLMSFIEDFKSVG